MTRRDHPDEGAVPLASTVALLRPADGGFETLMLRRNARVAFMGSAHVYPGGRVDPQDMDPDAVLSAPGSDPQDAHALFAGDVNEAEAVGLCVAAIRECFEEAGVLLAHDADGARVRTDGDTARRFEDYRRQLERGERSLLAIAGEEELRLEFDELRVFAHWITPVEEPKRFDTWFFVARVPPDQVARHDGSETVSGEWIRPREVLDRYEQGDVFLAPPTWVTLQELAEHDSVDAVLAWAARHDPVPILPRFTSDGGALALLLPGDEEYPSKRPSPPPHRIVLEDGRWRWPA